jgi:hypothetical protein
LNAVSIKCGEFLVTSQEWLCLMKVFS